MAHLETAPYIPTSDIAQGVYEYVAEAARDIEYMRTEIIQQFDAMSPAERRIFTNFHAMLARGDLKAQAEAARRTLLAGHIAAQVALAEELERNYAL